MDSGERSMKELSMRYCYGILFCHYRYEKREDVGCGMCINNVKEILSMLAIIKNKGE